MGIKAFMLLCFSLTGAASACDESSTATDDLLMIDGSPAAQLRFLPEEFDVGEPFELEITLCDPSLSLKSVDAGMPSHGHGMNYRPRIQPSDTAVIRAEGFLFHMPGAWEITVELVQGESTWRLVKEHELKP